MKLKRDHSIVEGSYLFGGDYRPFREPRALYRKEFIRGSRNPSEIVEEHKDPKPIRFYRKLSRL